MLMLLILHWLEYLASGIQVASNRVEHAVDVSSTAIGAVEFCKVNVFVYRHRYGDSGECNHLGYCYLHDYHIHECQSREVPVARCLAHIALVLVGIEYCRAEQATCKVFVFIVFVFRQKLLIAAMMVFSTNVSTISLSSFQ